MKDGLPARGVGLEQGDITPRGDHEGLPGRDSERASSVTKPISGSCATTRCTVAVRDMAGGALWVRADRGRCCSASVRCCTVSAVGRALFRFILTALRPSCWPGGVGVEFRGNASSAPKRRLWTKSADEPQLIGSSVGWGTCCSLRRRKCPGLLKYVYTPMADGLDHSLSNADISAAGNETRLPLQSAHAQCGSDYKRVNDAKAAVTSACKHLEGESST
eukprot:3069604-Prymnesium_polylepis.2